MIQFSFMLTGSKLPLCNWILLDSSTDTRPIRNLISAKKCVQNQITVFIDEGADLVFEIIVSSELAQK